MKYVERIIVISMHMLLRLTLRCHPCVEYILPGSRISVARQNARQRSINAITVKTRQQSANGDAPEQLNKISVEPAHVENTFIVLAYLTHVSGSNHANGQPNNLACVSMSVEVSSVRTPLDV